MDSYSSIDENVSLSDTEIAFFNRFIDQQLLKKRQEVDGFVALAVDVFNERDHAEQLISKIRRVVNDCARNACERNIDCRVSSFAAIAALVEGYDRDRK